LTGFERLRLVDSISLKLAISFTFSAISLDKALCGAVSKIQERLISDITKVKKTSLLK